MRPVAPGQDIDADGQEHWKIETTHVRPRSLIVAESRPWIAVSFSGGHVAVVRTTDGAILGVAVDEGNAPDVAWYENMNGEDPPLVVATGESVHAYRLVDGLRSRRRHESRFR